MKTETSPEWPPATHEEPAAAHCRRVALAAVELAKRRGWSLERQRELLLAAPLHLHTGGRLNARLLCRLVVDVWGYSEAPRGESPTTDKEAAKLLELCCLFVHRWEFIPYELKSFADIVDELRSIAQDRFIDPSWVESLATVPSVSLDQVKDVVAKLPVFPAVALKAMKVAQDPSASARHVEEIIGSDAVMAGEVLRSVNSSLYAPAMPIRSIRQAVVHMGLAECCRLIAAAAFRPLFQSPLLQPLCTHSIEVARLSESLAHMASIDPEEAFLVGLMHDVGRLALWKLPAQLTTQYALLLDQGCEPIFAETLLAGFDHGAAGREVVLHWKLPDHMARAVQFHHQPERSELVLAQVLYLAEHCSGGLEDPPSIARYRIALDRTGISHQQLCSLCSSTRSLAG